MAETILSILIMVLSGLIIFTIVVVVHELGHYWAAIRAGIMVEEFSIGMGPRIFSFKKGETLFSIKALPLGGSCRMIGMDEETSDNPRGFNSRPVGWRILVITGGSIMNFILALLLSFAVTMFTNYTDSTIRLFSSFSPLSQAGVAEGDLIVSINDEAMGLIFDPTMELAWPNGNAANVVLQREGEIINLTAHPHHTMGNYTLGLVATPPIEEAGAMIGDRILRINNQAVNVYGDFMLEMQRADGSPIELIIDRGGQELSLSVTPRHVGDRYILGFVPGMAVGPFFATTVEVPQSEPAGAYPDTTAGANYDAAAGAHVEIIYIDELYWVNRLGFFESMSHGFHSMSFYIRATVFGIINLITQGFNPDNLMGPIGIVTIAGGQVEQSLTVGGGLAAMWSLLNFTMLISASLGIINLLPLPAMDGGRLIFLIIEAIRRRPVPADKENMVHFAGFVLLMVLAVFIAYNDIVRLL